MEDSSRPKHLPVTATDPVDVAVRALSRDERRSRRHRATKARTENWKRLPKRALRDGATMLPVLDEFDRPQTRADCANVPRPCPWVGCKFNLYLDPEPKRPSVKLNFPDLEPDEMPAEGSCALDVADVGAATLERVGELANVTRERIRQIEVRASRQFRKHAWHLRDAVDGFTSTSGGALAASQSDAVSGAGVSDDEPWRRAKTDDPEERARMLANRVYRRVLGERGLASKDVSDEDRTREERAASESAKSNRADWNDADQAEIEAWLESDPWASRIAMRLDELAGKDSGTTTREGEAIRSQGLITHERITASSDAPPVRTTTPTRDPKKVGYVPTREGNGAPSSRPSRVGSLTENEPASRVFVAPSEGPCEVVVDDRAAGVLAARGVVSGAPVVIGASEKTEASSEESDMGANEESVPTLTEHQRRVRDAYVKNPSPVAIAKQLGLTEGAVNSCVGVLRQRGVITTPARAGINAKKPPVAAETTKTAKPKVISAPRAAAREVKAPSSAARSGDDPLLEAMRQRREALIAEHQTRLARIDAAIAAFTE